MRTLFTAVSLWLCLAVSGLSGEHRQHSPPRITESQLDCPIPHKDRIFNENGIQCVWAALETLGRWQGESKLYNLLEREECQGGADPKDVAAELDTLGVRYRQAWKNRRKSLSLLKAAMREGRGCLWSVDECHAMVLVHYDESANLVCWVDNLDEDLRIRRGTIRQFNRLWDGWVVVIYPSRHH